MRILTLTLITLLSFAFVSERTSLKTKSNEALAFCKKKNYNIDFALFVDMSIHSGKNRLFVYDFKKDSIVLSGLCSHGCGEMAWGEDQSKTNPIFSNTPESHLSSLGKYKVGKRGWSNWGINVNYKLHGLEASNSNAYNRFIVLHSWDDVPETSIYPNGTPEGWGCPAVSNNTMRKLDALLKKSSKPVLLWIYE
jgi:hypothetical protein